MEKKLKNGLVNLMLVKIIMRFILIMNKEKELLFKVESLLMKKINYLV